MSPEAKLNPPETASGLDPTQLAAEDIAPVEALFAPRRLPVDDAFPFAAQAVDPQEAGPHSITARAVELGLHAPRSLRLRIEPLPHRATLHRTQFRQPRLVLRRGLDPVLRVPLSRRRLSLHDLSDEQGKAIVRAIFKKYGEEAHGLHLEAVYPEVPAELAASVRLAPGGQAALISIPPGFTPAQASAGCWLVELSTPEGATRRTIFRL